MEKNEYEEVVGLVKVLDEMIAHMGVVIEELPDFSLQDIENKIKKNFIAFEVREANIAKYYVEFKDIISKLSDPEYTKKLGFVGGVSSSSYSNLGDIVKDAKSGFYEIPKSERGKNVRVT